MTDERTHQAGDANPAVLQEVDFAYPRSTRILHETSWTAPRIAGLVVIRGRSGSGKTTILNLISGLLVPLAGSVTTLGVGISSLRSDARRAFRKASIGYVFQDFRLLPELTAWENAALPLWLQGVDAAAARERAVTALDALDLGWARDRRPDRLSGGEQQRVGMARALATNPQLLLADEPTANLDDESARTVAALLRAAAAGGTAVIVASHDDRLLAPGDAVYELAAGKLTPKDGTPNPAAG